MAFIDTYTKLLLHCDGTDGSTTFSDNGVTGHTVTANGNAQIDTAQSKFGNASGLFDGTGDYLTIPDHADWNFGTGNFTIDAWIRFAAIDVSQTFIGQWTDGSNYWSMNMTSSNTISVNFAIGGVLKADYITTSAISGLAINTWYHIAFVRNTTNFYIFVNGISQALTTNTAIGSNNVGDVASVLEIGTYNTVGTPSSFLNGWLDEVRISKGIARWTANFTPFTRAYPIRGKVIFLGDN